MRFPLNTVNLRMMEDWKMSNSAQTSASARINGLLDEDSPKNDILNLRATIRNLQKYEVRPNWWNIPICKTSPNNPVEHLKSYW